MLLPRKQKYRKRMRGRMKGLAQKGNSVTFGDYGLKAMDRNHLSSRQIESARRAIVAETKRVGKLWIRVFPDKPTTKKGLGVRMGKGKGPVHEYVFVTKPGRIIFELGGISEEVAREAFRKAGDKLPFKTKFIIKNEY